MSPTVESLDHRIAALERSNRRWRRGAALLAGASLLTIAAAFRPQQTPATIEAQRRLVP